MYYYSKVIVLLFAISIFGGSNSEIQDHLSDFEICEKCLEDDGCDLKCYDDQFIQANFMLFYARSSFANYNVSTEYMLSLLERKKVIVKNETVIFRAIKMHMDAKNLSIDIDDVENFFNFLDLQSIPLEVMVGDVLETFDICENCRKKIYNAALQQITDKEEKSETKTEENRPTYIEALKFFKDSLIMYNPVFNMRVRKELNITKRFFGAEVVNNNIYVVGGRLDSYDIVSTADYYDLKDRLWNELNAMPEPRENVGTAVIDNVLYVIGGNNNKESLKSVVKLDITDYVWKEVTPMANKRSSPAVAVYNNRIYVAGGNVFFSLDNSVEMYDPIDDEWTEVVTIQTARTFAGMAFKNPYVYLAGGYSIVPVDGKERFRAIQNVERYDLNEERLIEIDPIEGKGPARLLNFHGDIIAIYMNDSLNLPMLQELNKDGKTWKKPVGFYSFLNNYLFAINEIIFKN